MRATPCRRLSSQGQDPKEKKNNNYSKFITIDATKINTRASEHNAPRVKQEHSSRRLTGEASLEQASGAPRNSLAGRLNSGHFLRYPPPTRGAPATPCAACLFRYIPLVPAVFQAPQNHRPAPEGFLPSNTPQEMKYSGFGTAPPW